MDKSQVTLVFKNDKHKEEFLAQIYDGFGENYVSITEINSRDNSPAFYIEMLDNDFFQDGGWHIEQLVSSDLWITVGGLVFDDRHEAIRYMIENSYPNTKLRVKEDHQDET